MDKSYQNQKNNLSQLVWTGTKMSWCRVTERTKLDSYKWKTSNLNYGVALMYPFLHFIGAYVTVHSTATHGCRMHQPHREISATWEHISAYNFFTDWNSDYQTYTPKSHMRSSSSTSIGGAVEHHYPIPCQNQNWKHSQVGSPGLMFKWMTKRSCYPCANHNSQY
jgi:hypothetical protein